MNNRVFLSAACAAVLAAAAGITAASAVDEGAAPDASEEMVRFERSALDEVWVRADGGGLERFGAVYLAPVTISYKDRRPDYELGEEEIERLDLIVREELAEALADRDGYVLAGVPGPGVLEIRAELAEMDINAPSSAGEPGRRVFVTNVGSMTLKAVLRDSETGENLVLVRDHVEGRDLRLSIATRATYEYALRDAVAAWSDQLRTRLDAARAAESAPQSAPGSAPGVIGG